MSLRVLLLASLIALGPRAARGDDQPPPLPETLTLDEAVRLARTRGLDLLIAESAVESARGDLRAAGAVQNPNLQAGYSRSFYAPGLFESPNGWSVGLGDNAAIEDVLSGKRGLRKSVAEAALKAARLSRADAERALVFQVERAYLAAVQARDGLDFARDIQKAMAQSLQLTQYRYDKGLINEADEARVETAKLEADQAVRTAEQSLEVAKSEVAFLLGVRGAQPAFKVAADLPKFRVPAGLATVTREALVDQALANRPDLQAADADRERAEAAIRLAKRLRFPDINFNITYSQMGSPSGTAQPPDAMGNPQPAFTPVSPPTVALSLAGNLPIFYQQQGEIQRAEADAHTKLLARQKVAAQVVSDVSAAFANFRASRDLVQRMEGRLLERAGKARELVQAQYEKGAASLLEYLDAQRTYIATYGEYLQDLANYWTAVYQLQQSVGAEFQ